MTLGPGHPNDALRMPMGTEISTCAREPTQALGELLAASHTAFVQSLALVKKANVATGKSISVAG